MFRFPFIPREHKFFDLFEESARNMVKAAQVLKDLVDTWEDVKFITFSGSYKGIG